MPILESIKDNDSTAYNRLSDLDNLIQYVMNPDKNCYIDPVTKGYFVLNGSTNIFPPQFQHDPMVVYNLMEQNKQLHDNTYLKMLKHRMLSFDSHEFVTPLALYYLGNMIMDFYFSKGYLGCFGVHTNTDNLHLHYIVDLTNAQNGNRFYIYRDTSKVRRLANSWYEAYRSENLALWDDANKTLFRDGKFTELTVVDSFYQRLMNPGVIPQPF